MSNGAVFLSPVQLSWNNIKEEVVSLGGWVASEEEPQECVVERDGAALYIFMSTLDETGFDESERVAIAGELEGEPQTVLEVVIGHDPGAENLARDVLRHFIRIWGGTVHSNSLRM